jgi:hypothetical protein
LEDCGAEEEGVEVSCGGGEAVLFIDKSLTNALVGNPMMF